MDITVKKSSDLTEKDWEDLVQGFNKTFQKESSAESLCLHYAGNEFGYTLHAIARDESGRFSGHTSVIPNYYSIDSEKVKIGLSGSTFIMKEARSDIFLFKKMYDALKESCRTEGMLSIMGVPNHNSYSYTIKVLKKKHLRNLNYYVLPVRPFRKKNLLNKVTGRLAKFNVFLQRALSSVLNFKEKTSSIEILKSDLFMEHRLGAQYQRFADGAIDGSYRIYREEGQEVAYIMHFQENGKKTYRALNRLVAEIIRSDNPDFVFYIGTLQLKQALLIKLPEKFEPKQLPLTITLLGNGTKEQQEKLLKPENWDFGLINFDVR